MRASGLIIISDLHAHPWAAFAKGDGRSNSRLQRTLDVLERSLALAREQRYPWVFGGDLVQTAGYSLNVVLGALTEILDSFEDVAKFAVWGNHDARGVGRTRITLEQTVWNTLVQANIENLTILDPSIPALGVTEEGGLSFSGAGAQPSLELLRYAEPSDVGVYHGTVRGSVGPNGYVFERGLDPAELLKRHRVVIVGDIHHPQQIPAPAGQAILVPGSPEHHNFGDVDTHGFWLMMIPEKRSADPTVEFYDSESPMFLTVDTADGVKDDGNYYRVRQMRSKDRLPDNATAVAPAPTVVQSRNILRGLQGEQILQAWVAKNPPPGDPQVVVEAGKGLLAHANVWQLQPYRVTEMYLNDFCCYPDQHFAFQPGTWLVQGRGRDFPSNGAGKSTLFEALFGLVFGRTTKGRSGNEVIRWGATACGVTARLVGPDGYTLRVTRTRGERSELEVEDGVHVWTAASVTEMTERLQQFLGITPELFQALGYFSQERVVLFASATDGERKEMLGDLIGLGAYQAAATAASDAANVAQGAIQRTQAQQTTVIRQIEDENTRVAVANTQRQQWAADHATRLEIATNQLAEFDAQLDQNRALLVQQALTHLSSEADTQEQTLREQIRTLQEQTEKTAPLPTPGDLEAARKNLEDVLAQARSERQDVLVAERMRIGHQEQLEQFEEALAAGTCPTCGQEVTAEHRSRCTAPLRDSIAIETERQAAATNRMNKAMDTALRLKQRVEYLERVDGIQQKLVAAAAAMAAVKDLRAKAAQQASEHAETVLRMKRQEIVNAHTRIEREINPHDREETQARQRLEQALGEHERLEERVRAEAAQQAVSAYWKHGFSKQGIQSLLMDEIAGLFNDVRGLIFPALTQGVYDVQFSTLSQTKAGELREKTAFQVFEHGQEVPYESLSGGQRRRIDVGVMLTLVRAVSLWMQIPGALGLLILDEVFGFLDESGAEGLADALQEIQAQVPSIYVISHDQQLQALFERTIVVEQDAQGYSHIGAGNDDDDRDRESGEHSGGNRGAAQGGGKRASAHRADRAKRAVRRAPKDSGRKGGRAGVEREPHRDGLFRAAREDGE